MMSDVESTHTVQIARVYAVFKEAWFLSPLQT